MKNPSSENFRSPAALARFMLTTFVGLALDLWTKAWAVRELAGGAEVRFLPGWLHFKYQQNFGAVFGMGQGLRPVFLLVSLLAIVFLTYLFATSGRQRLYQFILGLLLAGVLGNMYDRIVYGYVRDMVYALPRWPNVFPWIFNLADSMLCVGVFLLIVYSLIPQQEGEAQRGFDVKTES